jgi:hypothetical protein
MPEHTVPPPLARAVRALAECCWTEPSEAALLRTATVVRGLGLLATDDPQAFAAVLTECGMEGKAVVESQVVELVAYPDATVTGPLGPIEHLQVLVAMMPVKQHTEEAT